MLCCRGPILLQVKIDVGALFESLPEDERSSILGSKNSSKPLGKTMNGSKGIPTTAVIDLRETQPQVGTAQSISAKIVLENGTPEPAQNEVCLIPLSL